VDSAIALAAAISATLANPEQAAQFAAAGRAAFEAQFAETKVVAAWRDFCAGVGKA
jgi:hypothetical protein